MFEPLDSLMADHRYRLAFITFLALIVMFTKMEGNGLATWDDCFYAQKAKEIHQTGSWMTMHYAGDPAFENPPFFMWLVALSYEIWGTNEYAAIFPSALFGVLSVALVYLFAQKLFGSWTAFFASLVLTTTFFFTKYARHAMIDVTLSFFVTLALFALVIALKHDERYFILWGLSISVCILLKSVLGFFPPLITAVYLTVTGRWKVFFNKWFLIGSGLAVSIGCSWYVHQYMTFGNTFIDVHFGWLILQRGFKLGPEPWYGHLSYIEDLLRYYWPWVPVFAWSLYRFLRLTIKKDQNALLLMCWVLLYVGIMSLTQSRMLWYVMPIFPAAAIMCGSIIDGWLTEARRLKIARAVLLLGILVALIINLTPIQLSSVRERDIRTIAPYVRHLARHDVKLIGFGYTFHSLNNPLLFYSDHAARPIYDAFEDLTKQFADSQSVACVVGAEHLDSIVARLSNAYVIKRTDGACLIANKQFDVSGVTTW
jgi:4-amino-4-deoxy-L-arabinose transferase-like glycosyltransferase